ncbi:MAG TPA: HesA/MoeB/ThiF family protein [Firmicutes bacterium]|nr:HesA/MoeB/ThiF family protein [Candidatus Fermentithermobacillaceae bacterium]
MSSLNDFLRERARSRRLTDGKEYWLIAGDAINEASISFGIPVRTVELTALESGLVPARYAQNIPDLGFEGQKKMLQSCVAVVGAGGLGGYVCELLARLGVGRLIVIDGDSFEETNLNRQIYCTQSDLGKPKAEVAVRRIRGINESVDVEGIVAFATEETLPDLIKGADVLIDCVDSGQARLMLQKVCGNLGIPMVHGALGGFIGRVMSVWPGDLGVRAFYEGAETDTSTGHARAFRSAPSERVGIRANPYSYTGPLVGSPAVTPAAIAPWQVSEVLKIITGKGSPLKNEVLVIDLLNGRAGVFPLWAIRVGRLANRFRGAR